MVDVRIKLLPRLGKKFYASSEEL